jgi:lysozyme family protein
VKETFPTALAYVLQHEGGRVDDPHDPGGRTAYGITQAVYDDWRGVNSLPRRDVFDIDPPETEAIYRQRYWYPVRGDDLPAGLDYATFDFAVNSGVNRAARFLQTAAGVAADGVIGPVTLKAVRGIPPLLLIKALCDARLDFLKSLETFDRYGRGWTARVNEVLAQAKALA